MLEDMNLFSFWPRIRHDLRRHVRDQGPMTLHEAMLTTQCIEAADAHDLHTPGNLSHDHTNTTPAATPMDIYIQNGQNVQLADAATLSELPENLCGVPQREPPPHVHASLSSTSPVYTTIKSPPHIHASTSSTSLVYTTIEPPPHVHASTSSTSPVCTTITRLQYMTQEVLLDSGNNISSINADLVAQLQLPTSHAPPIKILFGDQQRLYHSHTQVMCMLTISSARIQHRFYVLPCQLFPITLDAIDSSIISQQLILPNHFLIALFTNP